MCKFISRFVQENLVSLNRFTDRLVKRSWNRAPLGSRPIGSRSDYLQLAQEARSNPFPEIEAIEAQYGYAISLDWLDNLAMHTQVVIKKSPLCYAHGRILYASLSRYLADQVSPSSIMILETGTARGFSALCMAKALSDYGTSGTILTIDLLPHRRPLYWNCIDDLDGKKSRAHLLAPWVDLLEKYVIFCQGDTRIELPRLNVERIHFAYLDGAHTYKDVLFEFNQIKDRQRDGDIIVFDDYTPDQYPEVVSAVDHICASHNYIPNVIKAHDRRGYVVSTKRGDG